MPPSRGRRTRLGVAIVVTAFLSLTSAQSTTSSSGASTSTSGPQVHAVAVGPNLQHGFVPNDIKANVGDIISFQFYPTNHSVVRGVWKGDEKCGAVGCNPCIPYELIHPDQKAKAFHSQNILTDVLFTPGNEGTVYNYTVQDNDPIWFYCTALQSCTPNGMVGVINAANGTSIEAQIKAAKNATVQLVPGQPWPAEGGNIPGAASNSGQNNSSSSSTGHETHDHRLSGGAIAGIAVGGAVVVLLAAALCYFVGRSNTYKEVIKARDSEGVPSQTGDKVSGWNAQNPGPGSNTAGTPQMQQHSWGPDHRFSGQTAYSQVSPQVEGGATFVGYNRLTGAPEFAQEVGSNGEKGKPTGHPAFGQGSVQETTYELPGTQPRTAELGQSNSTRKA